jgi:DNA-binding XRE family transcriptional regulator
MGNFPTQNDMTKLQASIANLIGSTKNFNAQIERLEAKVKAERETAFSKIGPMLKALRKERYLKQSTLSRQIGISGPTLSQIETGEPSASITVLEKIEKWLEKNA